MQRPGKYVKAIAKNPVVRSVKLADLKHNMPTLDELQKPRSLQITSQRY